ncbi:hypothetical protein [Lacinutrix jangbogonensis]|uniref:hypothetical protein n=1 Tax=Lacinutrix jangbogonensis TaxID=1469557 RepID=UPI00053E58B2|nr:hypothetical protein [Lacinutrix jangbogonensis]
MKLFKTLLFLTLSLVMLISFFQCKSSVQKKPKSVTENLDIKLEPKGDITAGKVYYQQQVVEQKSVISIFFPELANKYNYVIDKVYFRNRVGKIINGKASSFALLMEQENDINMSNEPNAEYGNTIPNAIEKISFKLEDNQCVVSYINGTEIKFYQIDNVVEKPN